MVTSVAKLRVIIVACNYDVIYAVICNAKLRQWKKSVLNAMGS